MDRPGHAHEEDEARTSCAALRPGAGGPRRGGRSATAIRSCSRLPAASSSAPCPVGSAQESGDRRGPARFQIVVPGLGDRGDGPSAGGRRGGAGALGPQPGRGGLSAVGPVRAPAAAHERLAEYITSRTCGDRRNGRSAFVPGGSWIQSHRTPRLRIAFAITETFSSTTARTRPTCSGQAQTNSVLSFAARITTS